MKATPETMRDEIKRVEGEVGVTLWEFLNEQEQTKKFGGGGRVVHRLGDLAKRFPPVCKPEIWEEVLADKLIRMAKKGWVRITPAQMVAAV